MSGLTRARNLCLAAAAAALALGAFVTTGAANDSTNRSLYSRQAVSFSAAAPHRPRASAASGHYVYVASKVVTLKAHKFAGGTLNCPGRAPHPVAGQFSSNSPVVFPSASFAHRKGWHTQLTNPGSAAAKVAIGTVCAP